MRTVSPAWFQAQAAVIDWAAAARSNNAAAAQQASVEKAASRHNYQLRWMLSPEFGLPRKPFRVFFLNAKIEMARKPDAEGSVSGFLTITFDVPVARVIILVNLTAAGVSAFGFQADGKIVAFSSMPGSGTQGLLLDGSAITSVLLAGTGDIKAVWSLPAETLANHTAWKEIEHVGLPLLNAADFAGTGYDTSPQGLVSAPVSPKDAALRRLAAGAPLTGWQPLLPSGTAAPTWAGALPQTFLTDQQVNFLPKLTQMMKKSGAPWNDKSTNLSQTIKAGTPGGQPSSQPSTASYSPLALLLMGASSDPYNALGLGFGTAYTLAELTQLKPAETSPPDAGPFLFARNSLTVNFTGAMVTCDVTLHVPLVGDIPMTLASVVLTNAQIEIVPAVTSLGAANSGSYPPQKLDGPWQQSVKLAWDRPQQLTAVQSTVASYAVARALPAGVPGLLNRPRPGGGGLPYVPALPSKDAPKADITFDDVQAPATAPNANLTYSVAAQDWFGIWSPWASASVALPGEPLQTPALSDPKWIVTGGSSPFAATLSVQVAWDWTTRSPKQMDVFVAVSALAASNTPLPSGPAPAGVQMSVGGATGPKVSITFDAAQKPHATGGTTVSVAPSPSYNSSGHDIRVYLLQIPGFSLNFGANTEIVGQIWASGQANLNPAPAMTSVPVNARTLSPVPPAPPKIEKVIWASLPDASSISRVRVTWQTVNTAAGYVVYQASETRMFAAAEDAGWVKPPAPPGKLITPLPDLTGPYAERTTMLRSLPWTKVRKAFTRVNSTALPASATELEVALPRGSRVIHAFVVTAVSANNIESAFPATSDGFAAVATPFVQTSRPPRISVTADTKTGAVTITLEQRGEVTPHHYDLLMTRRDDLATDAGLMGVPLPLTGVVTKKPGPTPSSPPASVTTVFTHAGVAASWKRVWYRAVGVTVDNRTDPAPTGATPPYGALGARSQPTEAVSVVLPPATAPAAPALSQQTLKSSGNVLLLLTMDAPAAATPLGSHVLKIVQSDGVAGTPDPQPVYLALETAPFKATMPLTGTPGQTFRMVQAGKTVIGIRLKASANTAVTITLTDPLGRVSEPVYKALL